MSGKRRNATRRMFRTTTMIRAAPVCALTTQIASICVSNVNLQQFFVRESRPDSFVVPKFTAETFVEPDDPSHNFTVVTSVGPNVVLLFLRPQLNLPLRAGPSRSEERVQSVHVAKSQDHVNRSDENYKHYQKNRRTGRDSGPIVHGEMGCGHVWTLLFCIFRVRA